MPIILLSNLATRMNTNSAFQQRVRFKADTPGLQSNRIRDTVLLLPDKRTVSQGKYTTWDDPFAPLKCAHVPAFKMTLSRPHVVYASACECVYLECVFCTGFQHMFWTERIMALFTPHYPVNK